MIDGAPLTGTAPFAVNFMKKASHYNSLSDADTQTHAPSPSRTTAAICSSPTSYFDRFRRPLNVFLICIKPSNQTILY
jgi:hypothetical protein